MKRYLFIAFLFLGFKSQANHIAGGEMIYDYLGNNNYKITLKIYRDCKSGNPQFDGILVGLPALLSVVDGNGTPVGIYDLGLPAVTKIPPTVNSPCISAPNNICIEEGAYTYTLNLPPKTGGYYVVYQRCCRNSTALNIVTPGITGSTYYAQIPGPETAPVNNSPRFKNFPPIFLCSNLAFTFDHSALDPDGDQLVYSLCAPFQGLDNCCSILGAGTQPCNPSCPQYATPPPYAPLNYISPFSGSYPIASNPSVTIDPATGLLSGRPTLIGQFVVGVCIQEFRNNVLIGTHHRDFQFNIISCVVTVISGVGQQTLQCQGDTIHFTNTTVSGSTIPLTYLWDFGVPNLNTDTSSALNPTYAYQDTGVYKVTLVANPGKPCTDTLISSVLVYPRLDVSFATSKPKQCLRNNLFAFEAEGVYVPGATFSWNFSGAATPSTSTGLNPSGIIFNQPGLYYVTLLARQFICRDSTQDTVRIFESSQAKINNSATALCDPAKIGFINGSTSDFPLIYNWNFSNGKQSSLFEPVEVFTPAGLYTASLTVITDGLCADTSQTSFEFVVQPLPISSFSCSPETTSIFEPEITVTSYASDDSVYWLYDFGDGAKWNQPSTTHFYQTYGTFLIRQTVTNQFGCSSVTEHPIVILPEYRFWVPNSFTPDNNALNDIFKPIAIGVENYNFQLFDRWGKKIFETNQADQGWNGKYNGKDCPQDVYIWRITFKNVTTSEDETHTGSVLILREE